MSRSKPPSRLPLALSLGFLVAGSLAVRTLGVDSDLPRNRLAFDEDYVVSDAFHFAADRTIVPNTFFYPPFYSYLVTGALGAYYAGGLVAGVFDGTDDFGWHHFLYPGRFHLAGRLLTLLFAGGTILVVYRLGRAYRGPTVGVLAAIFLAGETVHIERSHYALPDVPMTFFAALTTLGLVAVARHGRRRDFAMAGMALGLAAATKYNAAVLLAGLPLAHLAAAGWKIRPALRPWGPLLALGVATAAFLAAAPIWLLVPDRAAAGFEFEQANVWVGGHLGQTPGPRWAWVGRAAFATEPFLLVFLVAGLVAAPFRRAPGAAALAGLSLAAILYVGAWTKQSLHYLLPILPALVVLAADATAALVEAAPERRRIVPFLLAALAVGPGVRDSARWGLSLYRPDTRDAAREWIEERVPSGARVAVDSHMHQQLPDLRSLEHWTDYSEGNQDAPEDVREAIAAYGREAPLYRTVGVWQPLEEPDVPERFRDLVDREPSLRRHFENRWKTPQDLAAEGVEAIVTTSAFRDRFTGVLPDEDEVLYPFTAAGAAFYHALDSSPAYREAAVFAPGEDRQGPTIRVYLRR